MSTTEVTTTSSGRRRSDSEVIDGFVVFRQMIAISSRPRVPRTRVPLTCALICLGSQLGLVAGARWMLEYDGGTPHATEHLLERARDAAVSSATYGRSWPSTHARAFRHRPTEPEA